MTPGLATSGLDSEFIDSGFIVVFISWTDSQHVMTIYDHKLKVPAIKKSAVQGAQISIH